MRAKTAVKLRARGTAFKCDMCGRKLMTMDALVIHQRTAHNIITRRNKPKQVNKHFKSIKPQIKEKPPKKDPTPPRVIQKVKFSEPAKEESEKEVKEPAENIDNATLKMKTVEFKCPKCFSLFGSYFPAHKHIQKHHCVNKQGAKVPPNSPSLIQPIRIELCNKCNRKVKSIQTHLCDEQFREITSDQVVICTACDDWLPNLKSFDSHILSSHADDVESMFFPLSVDFSSWKFDMEAQTGVQYVLLEKYDAKRYYHCNYVKENDEKVDAKHYCPSTIVVQEFPKGVQVHFFKKHFSHTSNPYTLREKYKKFTITSFLKRTEGYNTLTSFPSDDNDLYIQFKSLMEGIIVDAAKINIATLKILHGKALNMTSILTIYDEEVEENDNQTDLEYSKMAVGKRKSDDAEITLEVKRTKDNEETHEMSPKILNSFSLATSEKVKKDVEPVKDADNNELEDGEAKNNKKNSDWERYSSSFNDSYKDFVVKNFPTADKDVKKKAKKPVVKTKIGQFKPSLSPKSPKTPEDVKSKDKVGHRLSFDKPIVDLKYEVKEQQDGCNILILKF